MVFRDQARLRHPKGNASIVCTYGDLLAVPTITVRNLPQETHRALKLRAAQHGRSTEAEVREILEEAIRPQTRVKVGSELAALGERFGGVDLDVRRDKEASRPADFE